MHINTYVLDHGLDFRDVFNTGYGVEQSDQAKRLRETFAGCRALL